MRRKTDPLLANGPIILSPQQLHACTRIRGNLRSGEAKRLHDLLAFHLGSFLLAADGAANVDLDLAKLLATSLDQALKSYDQLSPDRTEWLRVAVEYLVLEDDANQDVKDIQGLVDDANVVSAVLEHCGYHHLAKPIRDYLA